MTKTAQTEQFVRVIAYGPKPDYPTWVDVEIRGERYSYTGDPQVIRYFLWYLKKNQGHALAYIKKHASDSWKHDDKSRPMISVMVTLDAALETGKPVKITYKKAGDEIKEYVITPFSTKGPADDVLLQARDETGQIKSFKVNQITKAEMV